MWLLILVAKLHVLLAKVLQHIFFCLIGFELNILFQCQWRGEKQAFMCFEAIKQIFSDLAMIVFSPPPQHLPILTLG